MNQKSIKAKEFFSKELGEDVLQYIERNNNDIFYDYINDDIGEFDINEEIGEYYTIHIGDDMIGYNTISKKWFIGIADEQDIIKFSTFKELVEYTLSPLYKRHQEYIGCKGLDIDIDIDIDSWEDEYNPTFPE